MMLCERCGQNEATHHDLHVDGSDVRETHLCESCAQAIAGSGPAPASLGEWLTNFEMAPPVKLNPGAESRPVSVCRSCGLTFAELKKTGLVGCETCYSTFEERLTPLLQRAHDGGARHEGKRPSGVQARGDELASGVPGSDACGQDTVSVSEKVERLKARLKEAVAVEAYEEAAELRDRLQRLLEGGSAEHEQGEGGDA